LAQTYPRKVETKHVHGPIHISFYMFVLYRVKTSDASEGTVRRWSLPPFVLSLNRNLATSLKAYLNLWHFNLYQKISKLTFYLQKHWIYINFLSKCEHQRRLIAPRSGLVCTS